MKNTILCSRVETTARVLPPPLALARPRDRCAVTFLLLVSLRLTLYDP